MRPCPCHHTLPGGCTPAVGQPGGRDRAAEASRGSCGACRCSFAGGIRLEPPVTRQPRTICARRTNGRQVPRGRTCRILELIGPLRRRRRRSPHGRSLRRPGQYGVAPAKSLAMVAVMPRTTVGSVVMIPALRSSLVIAVVKLLLPAYTVVSLTEMALAWM